MRYSLSLAALLAALASAKNSTSASYTVSSNSSAARTTSSSSQGSFTPSSSIAIDLSSSLSYLSSQSSLEVANVHGHSASESSEESRVSSVLESATSPQFRPVAIEAAASGFGGTNTSNATSSTTSQGTGSISASSPASSASPTLPCENGTQYVDAGGYAYTLYCSSGSTASVISETLFPDGDFTQCMPLCDKDNACGGFEWSIVYESYFGCTLFGYNFSIDHVTPGSTLGVYTDTVTNPSVNQTSTNGTSTTATANSWSAAESCDAASVSWIREYGSVINTTTVDTLAYEAFTYIPPAGSTPTTTLCDGYPRAHGSAQYYLANMTDTLTSTFTTQITPMPNSAMPSCTINSSECSYLSASSTNFTLSQYSSSQAGLISSLSTPLIACKPATATTPFNSTTTAGSCSLTAFSQAQGGTVSCLIQGSHVQVAYWPVTETGNFLCGNGSTITPTATLSAPRIASAYGTTIASPGVLLSIDSLYAYDACGKPVGTGLSNVILTQQTSQISSQCAPLYHEGGNPGTQVNFADYNDPVPYSAYACMQMCNGGSTAFGTKDYCSTIFDGDFKPILALPTDIISLQPEWANCIFGDVYDGMNTIWDPPQALQAASTEAGVSVPAAKTTSASPASAAAQTTPHPTTTPSAAADNDPSVSSPAAFPVQGSSSGQGVGGVIASVLGMTRSSAAANADPTPASADGGDGNGGESTGSSGSESSNDGPGNGGDGSSNPGSTSDGSGSSSDPPDPSGVGSEGGGNPSNTGTGNADSGDPAGSNAGSGPVPSSSGPQGSGSKSSNSGSSGSSTANDPSDPSGAVAIATIGPETLKVDPSNTGNVVIAGTTLTPGQTTMINNTPISVGTGSVVIGSSTAAIPTAPLLGANPGNILTLGHSTVTATPIASASGAIDIDGHTLSAGQTATIDGHSVVAASGGVLMVDGTSVQLGDSSATGATAGATAMFTAGSSTLTAVPGSDGAIILDGERLTPGEATVINGQTVSDASGSLVVDGSSTIPFSQITSQSETVITAGSAVLIATNLPNGDIIIDGTTLSRGGPAVTIDGQVVSDGPSGIVVVSKTGATSTADPSSPGGAQPTKGDASFSQPSHVLMTAATVLLGAFYIVFL